MQQRFAAGAHHLRIAALLGGQFRVQQQPGHADHSIHRRADFVAHVGQKLALSFVGGIRRHRRRAGTFGFFLKASIALHQCCRRFLLGSDVPIRAHNFCRITRRIPPDQSIGADVSDGSIRPYDAELRIELLLTSQSRAHMLFFEVAVFRVYQGQPRFRTWDEFILRGAVKAVHLLVPVPPTVHTVVEPDARAACACRQFQPVHGLLQKFLRLLLRSDIPVCANHALGFAVGTPLNQGKRPNPVHAAIRPNHAELGVEVAFATQRGIARLHGSFPVLRMQSALPIRGRVAELARCDSIEAEHLLIPNHDVARSVPIPNAHDTRTRRQHQPVSSLLQELFRPFAIGNLLRDSRHSNHLAILIANGKRPIANRPRSAPAMAPTENVVATVSAKRCFRR